MDFLFDFTELLKPLAILLIGGLAMVKYGQFKEKIDYKQKQQQKENEDIKENLKYERKIRKLSDSVLNSILRK